MINLTKEDTQYSILISAGRKFIVSYLLNEYGWLLFPIVCTSLNGMYVMSLEDAC
jgi:hypothetical protein